MYDDQYNNNNNSEEYDNNCDMNNESTVLNDYEINREQVNEKNENQHLIHGYVDHVHFK